LHGHGGGHGDFAGFDQGPGHHHAASGSESAAASTHDHGTVWFFKVITFQTVVAALAFFGIAGKAARAADVDPLVALMIAVGVGVAAMYGVYYLIRFLHKFNADGTVRLGRAVGLSGIVYLPVPAANAGTGKIHMNLQNRTVELQAMTSQERLPSGTKVTVIGLIGSDTVQVERLIEAEIPSHV
jgi:hypothetical protein